MCSLVLMMHFVALRKTGTYFSSISSTSTLIVSLMIVAIIFLRGV